MCLKRLRLSRHPHPPPNSKDDKVFDISTILLLIHVYTLIQMRIDAQMNSLTKLSFTEEQRKTETNCCLYISNLG